MATEAELISRSESFEQAMKENALAQFCDYKVSSSEGKDQETWLYLRILFEADPKRCAICLTQLKDVREWAVQQNALAQFCDVTWLYP